MPRAEEPIGPEDTYGTLAERLAPLGGELLVRALDTSPPFHEQDEAAATYAEKITAEDRVLDPDRPGRRARARRARALAAHRRGADRGRRGPVRAPRRVGGHCAAAQPGDPRPGELRLDGPVPALGCTPGTLALTMVQPAGRRQMPGDAYLRGLRS